MKKTKLNPEKYLCIVIECLDLELDPFDLTGLDARNLKYSGPHGPQLKTISNHCYLFQMKSWKSKNMEYNY